MPVIENRERLEKALYALREYQASMKKVYAAQAVASEKLSVLKTLTGITSNDPAKIEEELLVMIGRAHVNGVADQ